MKKTGFIASEITIDHHVLGGVGIPLPVIKPDGDWTIYLPIFESQLEDNFDSDGCTCYGTTNAVETLEKFLYGTNSNYSDRFLYNAVGINPPGSDPHLVATTWRGSGAINEEDLPDKVTSLAEFMTPRPLTVDLQVKGQQWLNKQELGHQWLWVVKPDQATRIALLKEVLTKGTVCVSVTAWYKNDKGLYYSPVGEQNEHWTHIYKIDDTGIYVNDSYLNDGTNLKKLTLDHDIQFAKVYFLTAPTKQQYWFVDIIKSLLQLVGVLQKQQVKPIVVSPVKEVASDPYQEVKEAIQPKMNKIQQWANIIADLEGADPKLNNPGNIKFTDFAVKEWGATKAKDSDFAQFTTKEKGMSALCDFLTLACKNELIPYHKARTIKEFTLVYTDHPKPAYDYSDTLIKRLGVTADTQISTFL